MKSVGSNSDGGRQMDHGVLNIPLVTRGDIDRQLDAYKAQQAQAAKAKRKADAARTAELRVQAKAMVAAAPAELWERIGTKLGMPPGAVQRMYFSEAHWTPDAVIASLSREVA